MSVSSHRTILRSSSIIGGASVINILASIIKMKVVAVLMGPAGIGLIGLYQNLLQTTSSVAALGIANSGTRRIASAKADDDEAQVGLIRRALIWGTVLQSLLGVMIFYMLRNWIADFVGIDSAHAGQLAWLSLGIALIVISGAQSALLTGLRRVGDIALIHLFSGVLSAILGVIALLLWGERGLLLMVLIAPAISCLLGYYFVSRLAKPVLTIAGVAQLWQEWKLLLSFGIAFMLSMFAAQIGHLAVRAIVQQQMGSDALGQFQAAWSIGMMYLGFALGAMATDYYPRLSGVIHKPTEAVQLVNDQTEVVLLLCGPIIIALLGFAPWVIWMLYSAEFTQSVNILRWQLLGDILKLMSWPMGYILMARGAGRALIVSELTVSVIFIVCVYLGLPLIGIEATGIAYLLMYMVHLLLMWVLGGRMIKLKWTSAIKLQFLMLAASAFAVLIAAHASEGTGAVVGGVLAALLVVWAFVRLSHATGRLTSAARIGQKLHSIIDRRT